MKMIEPQWNFIHWKEQKVDERKSEGDVGEKRDYFVFEQNHTLKAGW